MSGPVFFFLSFTAIFILAAWALYLPYRMGQLHFLVIPNMVISAYFGALVSGAAISGTQNAANPGVHWPFFAVLLGAVLLSALIGFLASLCLGDAPCFAVAIVGLTFMFLVRTIAENTSFLGRTLGMYGVPRIIDSTQGNRFFLVILIYLILLLTGFLIYRFDRSPLGRAASCIFANRDMALSLGINIKKMGILLQTASSALGGGAGVLYLYVTRSISPAFITFQNLGLFMTLLFVGGYTTQWGILLVTPILWGIPLIIPEALQGWKNVFYALILIVILMVKPEGIITRPGLRKIFYWISNGVWRKK